MSVGAGLAPAARCTGVSGGWTGVSGGLTGGSGGGSGWPGSEAVIEVRILFLRLGSTSHRVPRNTSSFPTRVRIAATPPNFRC